MTWLHLTSCMKGLRRHPAARPALRVTALPGFTLAEVLVAVGILLIGVMVALRIFPTGFDLFTESQQTHQALKLLHQALANFDEDRQGLPDAILPVDYTANGLNWVASATAGTNYYTVTPATTPSTPPPPPLSASPNVQTQLPPSSQWLMGYLNAVDYECASASATQLSPYLAPDGSWPLWEPPSVRAMRRIIGERCQIPSAVYSMTTSASASAANVTLLPSYVPRFAPVLSNGYYGATQTQDPVIIYDLRYKRVTPEQLQGLLTNYSQLADHLYYAFDYGNQNLLILPDANQRNLRLSFYVNSSGSTTLIGPSALTVPSSASMTSLVYLALPALLAALPPNSAIIPGSEQLNRAYTRLTDQAFQAQGYAINTGQYYISGVTNTSTTVNSIYFAQADGGHVIKLDYTAADWNILHEDLVLDKDGYLTLALPDPKIVNTPDYPLEPNSLTVGGASNYGGMKGDGTDVVLAFIDQSTGVTYNVVYNPNASLPTQVYTIQADPMAPYYPTGPNAIDVSQSHQGLVRLGQAVPNAPTNFSAFAGHKYRIFYRARNNWTVQVYKPPSAFWQMSGMDALGWTGFYANASTMANQVYVPAVYQGQSVAVDYVYQRELCRAMNGASAGTTTLFVNNALPVTPTMLLQIYSPPTPMPISNPSYALASATNNGMITLSSALASPVNSGAFIYGYTPLATVTQAASGAQVQVNSIAALRAGMTVLFVNPSNPALPQPTTIQQLVSTTRITVSPSVAASNGTYIYSPQSATPLHHASGEQHVIAYGPGDAATPFVGMFRLDHLPAPSTPMSVRGVSVTVRALWMQPRSGSAWLYDAPSSWPTSEHVRALNERWQAKTLTAIMPEAKD